MTAADSNAGLRVSRWLALAAACVALLWIAHGETLTAPFVADDFSHVVSVAGDAHVERIAKSMVGGWYGFGPPWYYRPLAVLSFALDARLYAADGGPSAVGFHLVNLVAFAATALLLAGIVMRAWSNARGETADGRRAGVVAALAFCAFPGFAEAIGWISNRDGPLAVLFALLATWLQLRAGPRVALLAAGAYACALSSKELAVTLVVLPLLAVVSAVLHERAPASARIKAGVRASAPYALLVVAYLLWRLKMFGTISTGVPVWQADDLHGGGVLLLARNVLDWLGAGLMPFGSELVGPSASAFAIARVIALVVVAGCALRGALSWRTLVVGALGAAALATVMLGPIVFVTLQHGTLANARFLPLVALPFCASLGIVVAHARGRLAWLALGMMLGVDVFAGAAQSGAFALAAHDFERVRLATRDVSVAQRGGAATAPIVVLTDVPTTGLAPFPLLNAMPYLFVPPFGDGQVTVSQLSREQLRFARALPDTRPFIAGGWALLALDGTPAPAAGWRQRLSQSLYAAPRIAPGTARLLHPPSERSLTAPLQLDNGTLSQRLVDAFDVATIRFDPATGEPALARVGIRGDRATAWIDVAPAASDAVRIILVEDRLDCAACGRLGELQCLAADGSRLHGRITLLPTLPALPIEAPAPGATLSVTEPIRFVFTRPTEPIDRIRVHVVPNLLTARSSDIVPWPGANDALTIEFLGSMANGKKTTIDWRIARDSTKGGHIRLLAEGIVGDGAAERVVVRSAILDVVLR